MVRTVKREGESRNRVDDTNQLRAVTREKLSKNRVDSSDNNNNNDESTQQDPTQRRELRSNYLKVKNLISEKRDDIASATSDKFNTIITQVENLHLKVRKPREQVADAETLLDLANTISSSVKSLLNEGITAADFVTSLVKEFGISTNRLETPEDAQVSISWRDIGLAVSPIFRQCPGCFTMLGPMNTELKQRKAAVQRRRTKQSQSSQQPEEVDDTGSDKKTDTDKNMSTMFEILRRKKHVRLECLIFNRSSFAQTVENLFALSFLVKDGRADIKVDEDGSHHVSPRNAPAADSVMSGQVTYMHFVFRFDFKDWKLTMDMVPIGDELMPHRESPNAPTASKVEPAAFNSPPTPIRKLSRNRGLVVQEEYIVEDSPEIDDAATRLRRSKRKLV